MREGPIERHLCNLVSKAGGRAYKWVSPGNKGVPDRLVFLHGVIFLVETKSTRGLLSSTQKVQRWELERLGHHVVVLSSKEQVSEWVEMQSNALKPRVDHFRGNNISQSWIDELNDTLVVIDDYGNISPATIPCK